MPRLIKLPRRSLLNSQGWSPYDDGSLLMIPCPDCGDRRTHNRTNVLTGDFRCYQCGAVVRLELEGCS